MAGRAKILTHTLTAAGVPLLSLLISCVVFLHQKHGSLFFGAALLTSFILVAVFVGRSQSLGTALSLVSGLATGIFLVLLYGLASRHHVLSEVGKAFMAVLPASAVIGGLLARRVAQKTALLYPETEKNRAVRIIMIANLGTALVSMAALVALALIVRAV